VDLERLFSFSGGTITKLRNQLSDDSARTTVLVGQWANVEGLLAMEEFEENLRKGWNQKGKGKAVGDTADDAIAVDD
jgi:hypothetical protein